MSESVTIILTGLPKLSLNKWYASSHWSNRKKIKDTYIWLVKSQYKKKFSKSKKYKTEYRFTFKSNPLDASNCVSMIKLIEDIIFEDDKWDIVTEITISSSKGKMDSVEIIIEEI